MALVRFHGDVVHADPIRQTSAGDWEMRSRQHTGRLSVGTTFMARQDEILEMAAAEMPGSVAQLEAGIQQAALDNTVGLKELDAAMAEERKTLPTPAELIAKYREAEAKKQPERPF